MIIQIRVYYHFNVTLLGQCQERVRRLHYIAVKCRDTLGKLTSCHVYVYCTYKGGLFDPPLLTNMNKRVEYVLRVLRKTTYHAPAVMRSKRTHIQAEIDNSMPAEFKKCNYNPENFVWNCGFAH